MGQVSVTGKLILEGKIELLTPLIIGSGEKNADIDIVVQKDAAGKPYIPATSLAGVLRHYYFENAVIKDEDKDYLRYFWGADRASSENSMCQSALTISDLLLDNEAIIKVRDGVAIDHKYGVALEHKKFDYEVVEPGALFNLRIEVTLREIYKKDLFAGILVFLGNALIKSFVSVGAMTTKGFGRCQLIDEEYRELDFKQKGHVLAWLSGDIRSVEPSVYNPTVIECAGLGMFSINALFEVKNSLIVRSYSGKPEEPDAVHITSGGRPVLPGTSLKGAVRSRAIRIINTLDGDGEKLVRQLFGWADDSGNSKEKIKSRFIVEETDVSNLKPEIQHRIKIDRFTGGVIKSALFDSMPLWPKTAGQQMINMKIRIKKYTPWEAGLLLLLLKDLWSADLPVGGEKSIGRGVLKGISAVISFNGQEVTLLKQDETIIISGNADELEGFVQAFAAKCNGEEAVCAKC